MQRFAVIRYTTQPDKIEENVALTRAVYEELRRVRPERLAYATFHDGADFVHLFVNLDDDSSEALTELPSFKAFSKDIAARCVTPPEPQRLIGEMVDSYGLGA